MGRGEQHFRPFEIAEPGALVTLAAMSPEPGGAGGDGELVALVGMEARPG